MQTAAVRAADGEISRSRQFPFIYVFFFLSGFPALLYQIVWQRALFTIYGINIESVTMVVSAFMLGLGLGSLLGGWISERRGIPLLLVFGLIELGIGAFGSVSLHIFHYVARFMTGIPALGTGAITFVLVVTPTALMGSTLPILTEHLVRLSGNVGKSVGALYFVNALGSATACFAAAFFIMNQFGESGSVRLAALFNAAVSLTVITLHVAGGSARGGQRTTAAGDSSGEVLQGDETLAYRIALPIAGLAGLVALGYEILWYRAFSINVGGRAQAFALLLGFYLAGIAFGSLISRYFCHRLNRGLLGRHLRNIALFVLGANVISYLVLPGMALAARRSGVFGLFLVTIAAALLGATFPLICHAAVKPDSRAGRGLSWLYVSNIIGSTGGSFVVGYILMDHWSIRGIAVAIALTGLALGAAMLAGSERQVRTRIWGLGGCAVLALFTIVSAGPLFDRIYERLEAGPKFTPSYRYRDLIETKSGVAAVSAELKVYGGGVYDGMIHTSLVDDRNGLFRPFSLSYLHPAPREVLVIGLATGAWTQVIANNPAVEKITVVEINPGYLDLIRRYPQVSSLLTNPKITYIIDDGRRWMVRNRSARFDAIVSNTTFHWRGNISNLLSKEFLELVRGHLKPGGFLLYNLTGSQEAQLTGVTVFPYAKMIGGNMALSDSPFQFDIERWKRQIAEYKLDGLPVLDLRNAADRRRYKEVIDLYNQGMEANAIRAANHAARIITDDNMGTEWAGIAGQIQKFIP